MQATPAFLWQRGHVECTKQHNWKSVIVQTLVIVFIFNQIQPIYINAILNDYTFLNNVTSLIHSRGYVTKIYIDSFKLNIF